MDEASSIESGLARWLPSDGCEIDQTGSCVTAAGRKAVCLAGVICPTVGECSWRWRLADCPTNVRRSLLEVGVVLVGGDINDNVISTKLAPPGSSIVTASGTLADGELDAMLDMESGTFRVTSCKDGALSCELATAESDPKSIYCGIGALRGHLWRPFLRFFNAEGMSVEIVDFQTAGRAEALLAASLRSGCGNAEAQKELQKFLPGSGGQPGPGIGDIQCVLPAQGETGRGGLYISGGQAANEHNLSLIKATAMLRLGASYAELPQPEGVAVKVICISDTQDSDFGSHIDECNEFVENNLGSGANVLVHCGAGVSRSGAAVICYLMWYRKLGFKEAWGVAKKAREWIGPNPSFQRQLMAFEKRLAESGHYGS